MIEHKLSKVTLQNQILSQYAATDDDADEAAL